MRATAALALALTACTGPALACRQITCAGDVCATSPEDGSTTLCRLLQGVQSSNGGTLVGRDGCGWFAEPTSGVASALGCAEGLNRYTGTVAVWRANDILEEDKVGSFAFTGADGKSTVGSCKIEKNVDC